MNDEKLIKKIHDEWWKQDSMTTIDLIKLAITRTREECKRLPISHNTKNLKAYSVKPKGKAC